MGNPSGPSKAPMLNSQSKSKANTKHTSKRRTASSARMPTAGSAKEKNIPTKTKTAKRTTNSAPAIFDFTLDSDEELVYHYSVNGKKKQLNKSNTKKSPPTSNATSNRGAVSTPIQRIKAEEPSSPVTAAAVATINDTAKSPPNAAAVAQLPVASTISPRRRRKKGPAAANNKKSLQDKSRKLFAKGDQETDDKEKDDADIGIIGIEVEASQYQGARRRKRSWLGKRVPMAVKEEPKEDELIQEEEEEDDGTAKIIVARKEPHPPIQDNDDSAAVVYKQDEADDAESSDDNDDDNDAYLSNEEEEEEEEEALVIDDSDDENKKKKKTNASVVGQVGTLQSIKRRKVAPSSAAAAAPPGCGDKVIHVEVPDHARMFPWLAVAKAKESSVTEAATLSKKKKATAAASKKKKKPKEDDNSDWSDSEDENVSDDGGGKVGAVRDLQRASNSNNANQNTPPPPPPSLGIHNPQESLAARVTPDGPTTSPPAAAWTMASAEAAVAAAAAANVVVVVKHESRTPASLIGRRRLARSLTTPHVSATAGATRVNHDGEDVDVEWIGTANETRLPHMRQHCTDCKFDPHFEFSLNKLNCDLCYCYVCDIPAKNCLTWASASNRLDNHCHANDSNRYADYWKSRRNAKAKLNAASNSNSATATAATANNNNHAGPLAYGKGPFAPDHLVAQQDPNLTECRRCGYFIRFFHRNFSHYKALHPVGFLDWCHQCGRVASEMDFAKVQAEKTSPQKGDVFLGTKDISFRIKAHDPRGMENYEDNWLEADEEVSEWAFEEKEMREDLFHHRFGERPSLRMILASIPITEEAEMPSNGSFAMQRNRGGYMYAADTGIYYERCGDIFFYWKSGATHFGTSKPSVDETEGVLLENHKDLVLLQQLFYFEEEGFCKRRHATKNTEGKKSILSYEITAKWDKKSQRGTFAVQVYVRPPKGRFKPKGSASFNKLLGAWFDVFPFNLAEISGSLKARLPTEDDRGYGKGRRASHTGDDCFPAPPFKLTGKERMQTMRSNQVDIRGRIKEHNTRADAFRNSLCLESTHESKGLGGVSPPEAGFSNALQRYFGELLVEDVTRGHRDNHFVNNAKGITSSHRSMRRAGTPLLSLRSVYSPPSELRDTTYDLCYVKAEHRPLAYRLRQTCTSVFLGTTSMASMIAHLENLNHEEVPYFDGLKVELLQFQRQSVFWALERETIPGGIQSLLWPEVPRVVKPRKTQLYYNPIIETFRQTKPHTVRGGIIAEEMGLGKTVISLALILVNPAPLFPESGSPVEELDESEESSSGWDKDLYARTSIDTDDPDANPKRGSIISRGTLVVVCVSLVGQWVEEARSKLKNPGLVYPYHGSGRNRDPAMLSDKSIVVTTYETLASDNTYHREKDGSPNYVPPLSQVRWWRVICDESHSLRDGTTTKSRACMGLIADHKWLVSGTPCQTSLLDFKNQLKWLGLERVDEIFQRFGNLLFHTSDRSAKSGSRKRHRNHEGVIQTRNSVSPGQPQFANFLFLMRLIMIRHSQGQKYRGTPTTLMSLPAKTERSVEVEFSQADRVEYDLLEVQALAWFTTFKGQHHRNLGKYFLKLKAKLNPMRIACAGGRIPLDAADDSKDLDEDDEEEKGEKKRKVVKFSKFVFKSKFDSLIQMLLASSIEDPTSKSLVFSQFPSSLLYLQEELPKHGFQFRTLSGDMPMKKRAKALHDFQTDPPTTVFLLSMRSGSCGINLTQANRVYILEPCFNPALLAQSIGRVYRLGQKRQVEVVNLCMKDSVEGRMTKMLESKYGARVNEDPNDDDGNNGVAAASNDTLVGSVNSDKAQVVAAEFDLLFGLKSEVVAMPAAGNIAVEDGVDNMAPVPDGVLSAQDGAPGGYMTGIV